MRILSAEEVRRALPMQDAIQGMKQAYAAFSAKQAQAPQRTRIHLAAASADALFMPAAVQNPPTLALKAVNVFPGNPARGLPLIHAAVLVFDAETGQTQALLEGGSLTAIRTGAGSGAAIDLLARPESRTLAIFGAGTQGRTQMEAACTVRPIETIWIYDQDAGRARQMAAEMAQRVRGKIYIAASPREAVSEADIICTATTAANPVFDDADLKPGVHISAIGAYRPDMREIPPETLGRARVFVDALSAAQQEAGDLLFAMESGFLSLADMDEIGDLVNGIVVGRQSADEITVFKSVGIAVQDAVAAHIALQNAQHRNLGVKISF